MEIRVNLLLRKDLHGIKPLLKQYKFKEFRNCRIFSQETQTFYLFRQIEDMLSNRDENKIIVAVEKNDIVGLASLSKLPWASQIFAVNMGKIEYLISRAQKPEGIDHLIEKSLKIARNRGLKFLLARVDTADFLALHSLERAGFNLMDSLLTYLFDYRKGKPLAMRRVYPVRQAGKRDFDSIVKIAQMSSWQGHWHADPRISDEKANCLYVAWAKKLLDAWPENPAWVTEKAGKVVGYAAIQLNQDLAKLTGKSLFSAGAGAVLPEARGAYLSLQTAIIQKCMENKEFALQEVEINNYPSVKILQKLGFELVRSRYTFHKWLE